MFKRIRDRIAWDIMTLAANYVASPEYFARIEAVWIEGTRIVDGRGRRN